MLLLFKVKLTYLGCGRRSVRKAQIPGKVFVCFELSTRFQAYGSRFLDPTRLRIAVLLAKGGALDLINYCLTISLNLAPLSFLYETL